MKKRRWLILLTAIVVLGLALVLVFSRLEPESKFVESDLIFQDTDGTLQSVVDADSKLTLVNFWATWCPPCIRELPSIESLYRDYKGRGLQVVGINLDPEPESRKAIDNTRSKFKLSFSLGTDPSQILVDRYDVVGIPVTVLLDSKGETLFIERGERDWNSKEVRSQLDHWLSQ